MRYGLVVALAAICASASGAENAVEPEQIDVVYGRLVEQRRALEAVAEIVARLEVVAAHPEAASALLSDQGEPTERLRRALNDVASRRRARSREESAGAAAPRVVEQDAGAGPAEGRIEVVYAETGRAGGRVVLGARGAHYAAAAGETVDVGGDVVEVVSIRPVAGGGVAVELRINRGVPIVRRAGS